MMLLITFSEDLYNLLIFYRHICSYIELLIRYWSTPMVTIYVLLLWLQQPFYNDTLLSKWFNLNDWINHFIQCTWFGIMCNMMVPPYIWKQRYYFPGWGSLSPGLWVLFLCWYCSESDTNKIWALGAVTLLFGWGGPLITVHCHHPIKYWHLEQWHCDCLYWGSQTTEHNHNPTKSVSLAKWHFNFFWGFQTTEHRHQQKHLKSACILNMGWMYIF